MCQLVFAAAFSCFLYLAANCLPVCFAHTHKHTTDKHQHLHVHKRALGERQTRRRNIILRVVVEKFALFSLLSVYFAAVFYFCHRQTLTLIRARLVHMCMYIGCTVRFSDRQRSVVRCVVESKSEWAAKTNGEEHTQRRNFKIPFVLHFETESRERKLTFC